MPTSSINNSMQTRRSSVLRFNVLATWQKQPLRVMLKRALQIYWEKHKQQISVVDVGTYKQ